MTGFLSSALRKPHLKTAFFLSGTSLALIPIMLCSCSRPQQYGVVATPSSEGVDVFFKGFVTGEDEPFAQCHASSIVRTRDDSFIVAWFAGTAERNNDVGIWISKGTPDHWSVPVEIAKVREHPHWNPVLFNTPGGRLILFFKVGETIGEWETWYMVSNDDGNTWSRAQELVPGDRGGRGPVRNKPIVLSDGTWLAPASDEKGGLWNAFVDRSEDQGRSWTATPFIPMDRDIITGEGVIQPALWESSPGIVHMLLRSSAGAICRSDSKDYGKTWSPVYKTSLPNNNSGIDLTQLEDGRLVLAYNPVSGNWAPRTPLAAAVSADNGVTWSEPDTLDSGESEDEFSYPSILHYGDTVAGTYTWKRQRIAIWMGVVR